jgi:hypothetical protein
MIQVPGQTSAGLQLGRGVRDTAATAQERGQPRSSAGRRIVTVASWHEWLKSAAEHKGG